MDQKRRGRVQFSAAAGPSPDTAALIDRETRRLVDEGQATAMELLRTYRAALKEVAEVLVDRGVISDEDVARIAREAEPETERVAEA